MKDKLPSLDGVYARLVEPARLNVSALRDDLGLCELPPYRPIAVRAAPTTKTSGKDIDE